MPNVITATIAAPIATAIVGSIAARLGLGYRTKQVEYLEKRLSVITAALRSDGSFCTARQREDLTRDFRETVERLLATSVNAEEERTLAWYRQPWWRRRLTVPRPQSPSGLVATIIFYFFGAYFLSAAVFLPVFYFLFHFSSGALVTGAELSGATAGLILYFALAAFGNRWAAHAARGAVLMQRSEREARTEQTAPN